MAVNWQELSGEAGGIGGGGVRQAGRGDTGRVAGDTRGATADGHVPTPDVAAYVSLGHRGDRRGDCRQGSHAQQDRCTSLGYVVIVAGWRACVTALPDISRVGWRAPGYSMRRDDLSFTG
jgi:hypothetical protein